MRLTYDAQATDVHTGNQVAIKLEHVRTEPSVLKGEAEIHKEREQLILDKKRRIAVKDLCKGLPKAFAAYFNHIRSLGFDDTPNYAHLRKSFRNFYLRDGHAYDNMYDRTVLKYMQAMESEKMKNDVDANMDTVAHSDMTGSVTAVPS